MRQVVNILMLGGAKRVSMARMLKDAGSRMGLDVVLFSYELTPEVPVAVEASVITGLKWNDPDLMDDLHNVVSENRIDILLPFVDPAVEVAARFCESTDSCWTPMHDAGAAILMFDKVEADTLFRSLGFPLPLNPRHDGFSGPVIAKPRCGSASKGIKVLSYEDYLDMASSDNVGDYLFQQYIADRQEITVDCYVSSVGEVICSVPRVRLDVVGGEVLNTVTVSDPGLERLSADILSKLRLRGAITLQFLRERNADGSTGAPLLMEINPRLGGGAVCSVHAGADIPAFILADWLGQTLSPCKTWRAGVKICRYMQEVVFPR